MLSRIRKWWADRKLARRAREAPRWASGGYVGNSPRFERGGYVDNGPLLPSEPFFVAPIYRSECPPPHERSHDDGRCQVIPIAQDSGYGSSYSDSGSSGPDSGGSSDSGCSGGGGGD
jgi:hypothetical protein